MKIVLSRKGFDSGIGKVPSPIFPSGELFSLPIPEYSPNECAQTYTKIMMGDLSLGVIVHDLTQGKIKPNTLAHLDPDLNFKSLPRSEGWKPIFGQTGTAESHLRKNNIGEGDVFLFFGWFKQIHLVNGRYKYVPNAPDLHIIFGWLQIEKRISVAQHEEIPKWALEHPHCKRKPYSDVDCIYIATDEINLPKWNLRLSGAGVFTEFHSSLRLTADNRLRSVWKLPLWFYPKDKRTTLSYHGNIKRWHPNNDYVLLETVGRGQEFILDCNDYPEALDWLADKLCLSKQMP